MFGTIYKTQLAKQPLQSISQDDQGKCCEKRSDVEDGGREETEDENEGR